MSARDEREGEVSNWRPVLAIAGVVVGGAAWIAALGSAVMWLRLDRVDVSPGPTVALLPADYRVVLGARYLVVPLVLALLGLVVILLLRRDDDPRHTFNERGTWPRGLVPFLVVLGLFGDYAVIQSGLSDDDKFWLIAVIVAAAFATLAAVWRVRGFLLGALLMFACILVFSGGIALLFEALRTPKLDIGVVARKDGTALGGFYLAQTDDSVLIIAAELPSGRRLTSVRSGELVRGLPDQRCDELDDPAKSVAAGSKDCYVNTTVSVPSDDVRRVTIGPRGIPVTAEGYAAAQRLALASLRRVDEQRLVPRKKAAKRHVRRQRRRTERRRHAARPPRRPSRRGKP
jgi:hypothetical protein